MKDDSVFPYPNEFNLDNFSPEVTATRPSYLYMSFGQGPRNCIARRMAFLMIKIALVYLLNSFVVKKSEDFKENLEVDPRSQSFVPKGGVWVKVEKREREE